jgi:Domain of unknown function (DUF6468)
MWAFAIDMVFITLLVTTIVFAFRLERRLASLRGTKEQLAAVIGELNAAAARAEAGIRGLKSAAETTGATLEDRVKRARSLNDDLTVLVQTGQRVAQKLELVRPAPRPREEPRYDAPRAAKGR